MESFNFCVSGAQDNTVPDKPTERNQVAKKQRAADAKFVTLVETMVDVYSFVGDVESLPRKIKTLENKGLAIVQQTVECAFFIQEYSSRNFRAE
jgi:hypothetical protein